MSAKQPLVISNEEQEQLRDWMRMLAPDYETYNHAHLMAATRIAGDKLKHDKSIYDGTQRNLMKLIRRVATNPARETYGGIPFPWWWLAFETFLLYGIKQDPWSEVKWWLWNELRGKGKVLTMWGCQNSTKTSWMARFSVVQMAAWLQHAEIYVSGPFKLHSDDKVWAGPNGIVPWIEMFRKGGNQFSSTLNLGFTTSNEVCTIYDKESLDRGVARFISLENASAAQGKKSAEHDTSGMIGVTALIVDEFIENPNLKLKQAEGNIASNYNFFGILGCNPKPDAVQHPGIIKFSEPKDVSTMSLKREVHFRWPTPHGLLVRFAWQNCPNRILGRTAWPYMLSQERLERAQGKEQDTIDAQIDAWGWGSGARNSPLDEAAIQMAGSYNVPVWNGATRRVMHLDAAFGGADPASATILEAGEATIMRGEVVQVKKVLAAVEQLKIDVDSDFTVTDEWLEQAAECFAYTGGGFPHTVQLAPPQAGDKLGGGWDLAIKAIRVAIDFDVPADSITFDSSQRGDCTTVLIEAFGRHNISWFYEGSRKLTDEEALLRGGWYMWPYRYEMNEATGEDEPMLWSSFCNQTISMIWFFGCEFIRHGYLLNAKQVSRGLAELCARPVVRGRAGQTEGRRDVMGKKDLKEMGIKSPTWGEGVVTAIYFAVRFKKLITLEGPKLALSVSTPITPEMIIRAPGGNRRFRATRGWFSKT